VPVRLFKVLRRGRGQSEIIWANFFIDRDAGRPLKTARSGVRSFHVLGALVGEHQFARRPQPPRGSGSGSRPFFPFATR